MRDFPAAKVRSSVRRAVVGAVSGFAATVAMTAFMLAADRAGWKGRKGPEVIVQDALDAAKVPRARGQELVAIATAHAAFGAGNGALYAAADRRAGGSGHSVLSGVLFGIALWAVSYQGWVPAMGALGPLTQDRRDRQARIFLAHIVYGGVLGWSHRLLSRRGAPLRRPIRV